MATEYQINFSYKQSIAKADELDRIADKLQKDAIGELDNAMRAIKQNWEGENSVQFLNKCKQEKLKIEDTIKDIKETSKVIRQIAENTKQTEMKAIELAKQVEAAAKQVITNAAKTGSN